MTPLAHRIVKELTLPKSRRTFEDHSGLLARMDDIHCFEVTALAELMQRTVAENEDVLPMLHEIVDLDLLFLPAPKTWLEVRGDHPGHRFGVLLREVVFSGPPEVRKGAFVSVVASDGMTVACIEHNDFVSFTEHCDWRQVIRAGAQEPLSKSDLVWALKGFALFAVALINTPGVINRRQHAPHAGLERALLKNRSMIGRFPLHAWTEIKLEVGRTRDASCDQESENHYTGNKALHWCRAHKRRVWGSWQVIKGHWRGDPALGIKRSRYVVTPASGAAP